MKQLQDLMLKFSLRALKTFQKGKTEPLNHLQLKQIIEHELEQVIENISEPRFLDVLIRRTTLKWVLSQEE